MAMLTFRPMLNRGAEERGNIIEIPCNPASQYQQLNCMLTCVLQPYIFLIFSHIKILIKHTVIPNNSKQDQFFFGLSSRKSSD